MSVGQLNVSTACDIGPVRRGLGEMRGLVGQLDVDLWNADKAVGKIDKSFIALAGAAGVTVSALGAVAAGVAEVKAAVDRLDEIGDLAARASIDPARLAELGHAAKMSGSNIGAMAAGLGQLNRRVSEAAQGNGKALEAIAELGLSARQLNALPVDQKFLAVADAISKVQNPADQARLAFKLFGAQGIELIETLQMGRAGLADFASDANSFGIVHSDEDIQKIKDLKDSFLDLGTAIQGVAEKIAIDYAPPLTWLIKETTAFVKSGALQTIADLAQPGVFLGRGVGQMHGRVSDLMGMGGSQGIAAKVKTNAAATGPDPAQLEAAEKLTEEYQKQLATLQREHAIARDGKIAALHAEETLKFNRAAADELRRERVAAENFNQQARQRKEAAAEAESQRKERERQREQKAREAERKHLDNIRKDNEAIQKLRERVLDFGKTDLQRDRDQLLRTLENPRQRLEAMRHFQSLERMQQGKDDLEQMQKDRKNLASRGDGDKLLDARTAEGWAALRDSAKDLQIKKMDEQIAVAKQQLEAIKAIPREEIFKF